MTITQETKNNTIALLEDLQKQPIYHLSLADKELFHSNFLAWLGINPNTKEYFIHIIEVLIGYKLDWSEAFIKDEKNENFKVEREFRNFDLCILKKEQKRKKDHWVPILVLENKNKSIPYIKQLDDYWDTVLELYGYKKTNNITDEVKQTNKQDIQKNVTFILLSLAKDFIDKESINKKQIWKIISYCELHDTMNDNDSKMLLARASDYEKNLINDYIKYIDNLHELATSLLPNNSNKMYFLHDNVTKELKEQRLHDLSEKLRYSKFAAELKKKLENEGYTVLTNFQTGCADANKGDVFVNNGYTSRGGGAGFFEVAVKIHEDFVLKIQVQGEYYRHVIEWVAKCSSEKRSIKIDKEKFESLKNTAVNKRFFRGDYRSKAFWERTIFEEPINIMPIKNSDRSKSTILWDCFNNFDDGFKYQYVIIKKYDDKQNNIEYTAVIEAMIADVEDIKKIIDNF